MQGREKGAWMALSIANLMLVSSSASLGLSCAIRISFCFKHVRRYGVESWFLFVLDTNFLNAFTSSLLPSSVQQATRGRHDDPISHLQFQSAFDITQDVCSTPAHLQYRYVQFLIRQLHRALVARVVRRLPGCPRLVLMHIVIFRVVIEGPAPVAGHELEYEEGATPVGHLGYALFGLSVVGFCGWRMLACLTRGFVLLR